MYFKLTQWPTVDGLNAVSIKEAKLHLNYYKQSSYQTAKKLVIDAYLPATAWDTSTICWNNKPDLSGNAFGGTYIENSVGVSGGTEDVNVTDWVRARYASPGTDKGVCLKPRTVSAANGRACFISSDYYADTSLRPIINIIYYSLAQEPSIKSGELYYLKSKYSGMYATVKDAGRNTAKLVQNNFTGKAEQIFRISYVSGGFYKITPLHDPEMRVNVPGSQDSEGQYWQIYNDTGANGQRFRILPNDNGTYRILPKCSSTRVMYVEGTETSNGATIGMKTWASGAWRMQWILQPVTDFYLNTPVYGQEDSLWCWLAAARMDVGTQIDSIPSQTEICAAVKGMVVNEGGTTEEQAIASRKYSGNKYTYSVYGVLPKQDIIHSLKCGLPVQITRGWYPNGEDRDDGHATVIYGYNASTDRFYVNDPSPVGIGESYTRTYAELVDGRTNNVDNGKLEHCIVRD